MSYTKFFIRILIFLISISLINVILTSLDVINLSTAVPITTVILTLCLVLTALYLRLYIQDKIDKINKEHEEEIIEDNSNKDLDIFREYGLF